MAYASLFQLLIKTLHASKALLKKDFDELAHNLLKQKIYIMN